MLNREITILKEVKHKNLVEFFSFEKTKNTFYLSFELCKEQNFGQFIKSRNKVPFEELEAQKYFKQIADILIKLDENNIIHRDVKPDNILIAEATDELKLADLGLAR